MNGCIPQIHTICSGPETQAQCVRYTKETPEVSKLSGTCNSVDTVLTDVYSILDKNINFKGLGEGCIKYKNDPNLRDILLKQESEICELKGRKQSTGESGSICSASIEDCGLDLTGLVDKCTGVKPKTLGELLVILIDKVNSI